MKQHLQAQQLDGGEGGGDLDAGVQAQPRGISWAVKTWGGCSWRKKIKNTDSITALAPSDTTLVFMFAGLEHHILQETDRFG